MSRDDRPPTATELEELSRSLETLKTQLAQQLDHYEQDEKPVDLGLPIGRLTRMDAMQQQSMSKANRGDARLRLRQVEAAIESVAAGDYGDCSRCEETIGYSRLAARPETRLCLDCQESLEASRLNR